MEQMNLLVEVNSERVRLFNSGQVYKNVKYKVQFDFDGDGASFKDVHGNNESAVCR